jgi:hypothetical protein
MAQIELKSGLGTSRRRNSDHGGNDRTVKLFHVVVNGHTVATHTNRDDAMSHIRNFYGNDALRQALKNEKKL